MKKMWLLLSLVVFLFGAAGCVEDDGEPKETPYAKRLIEKPTPVFEALKGEWTWVKTNIGGFRGDIVDAEYLAIIQILSQNADSSINFKTFVNHTMLKEGAFMDKRINDGTLLLTMFDKNITSHSEITTPWDGVCYLLENDYLIFEEYGYAEPIEHYYAKVK